MRGRRTLRLAGAVTLALLGAGSSWAGQPEVARLVVQAQASLNRGEGVSAELLLRKALTAGADRREVAAMMGDAYIQQGDLDKAREWLGPGDFVPSQQAYGFRTLGLLERFERNLPAAGQAYDRALKLEPRNSMLWVDIGRLRYLGGEQLQAIGAVQHALELDPGNVRALEFRGQLVLDQFGPVAAVPWFEAALVRAPNDSAVLAEYAATLGEIGRASEMLTVTRRILKNDPRNPHAFFLQAALAARAGNSGLARALLNRTGGRLDAVPAAILLTGILEFQAGNTATAREAFEHLLRLQPANPKAALLVARSLYATRGYEELIDRFAPLAIRADASPYLLTLVGRAYEELGNRAAAAPLLDRAGAALDPPVVPIPEAAATSYFAPRWAEAPLDMAIAVPYLRALLGAHQYGEAETVAERMRTARPGSGAVQALAGDVQLALHRGPAAADRYRAAAEVRISDGLLARLFAAEAISGQGRSIAPLAGQYAAMHPESRFARRLAAAGSAATGDWGRATTLLESLRDRTGDTDFRLLSDLALAQLRAGDPATARETARGAYFLQRGSAATTLALAMALIANGERGANVSRLIDKAEALAGDNPLVRETRAKLARR